MKPHLIITLSEPVARSIPYWETVLSGKAEVPQDFIPSVDRIIKNKYNHSYWLTFNFKSAGDKWTPSELKSGFHKIYRLILQRETDIPQVMIDEIKLLPEVVSVRAGNIVKVDLPENQLVRASSLSTRYRKNGIYLKEAHNYSKGNSSIKIAILDTGFEMDHPELRGVFLPGKDFVDIINGAKQFIGDFLDMDDLPEDEVGHGTHVAGIIAGKGHRMPIGVVPNCKIIPVKVLGALKRGNNVVGAGLIDNINNGIKWAIDQGADVINMSLGIKHLGGGLPHQEVIRYALRKGVTVVAASGNDGQEDKYYPGALPGVIAVGAADPYGQVAPFSTFGAHVSVIAPGTHIYSSFLKNGYSASSGTSQAAPFVAGGIALLKSFAHSLGKQINDRQIKYILKHTSDKISNQFKDHSAGFGHLNLLDALKLLQHKLKLKNYA